MHNYPDSINTAKQKVRKEILRALKDYPLKEEESLWIAERLLGNTHFLNAEIILAYKPLKSEPDLSKALSTKTVGYPYIENDKMYFSLSESFGKSSLGFSEPLTKMPLELINAVMIVPLVAFDDTNRRLGRGGGFYDRYIRENKDKLYTIGVGFSPSFIESVPSEEHDAILDEIISPAIARAIQQ